MTTHMPRKAAKYWKEAYGLKFDWPDDAAFSISVNGRHEFKIWEDVMEDRRKRQVVELKNKRCCYDAQECWVRLWAAFNPHWCYHGWFLALNSVKHNFYNHHWVRMVDDRMRNTFGIEIKDQDAWIEEFAHKFYTGDCLHGYPRGAVLLKVNMTHGGGFDFYDDVLAVRPFPKVRMARQLDLGIREAC